MKRLLDIVASFCGLVMLCPLFALVAVLIKRHDGGSVFFRQQRIGQHGKPFRIMKFRTMVEDAQRMGLQITTGEDKRITPLGRWLRQRKMDELPQLINVLLGDMSLVGPRPEVPKYVALYTPQQQKILDCRPGITDPASLEYFRENELLSCADDPESVYISQIMPEKLRINLVYSQSATLFTDLFVIYQTLLRVAGWRSSTRERRRLPADSQRKAA